MPDSSAVRSSTTGRIPRRLEVRHMDVTVFVVVLTALIFDFTNGFHDTANAMATSIATGALLMTYQ
jgi:hypothetical protein